LQSKSKKIWKEEREKMTDNNDKYDRDSSPEAWEYYDGVYKSIWEDVFDFDKKKPFKRGQYIVYKNNPSDFQMAGDVIFNFGEDNGAAKSNNFYIYKRLLEKSYSGEELEKHIDKLKYCANMRYENKNFSLMPITGGLQGFKQFNCDNDRADKFLHQLKDYFVSTDKDKHSIICYKAGEGKGYIRPENKELLKKFFKERFGNGEDGFKEYCKKIYLINESTAEKMVKNGEKEIESGKDVVGFMKIATLYWEDKEDNNAE